MVRLPDPDIVTLEEAAPLIHVGRTTAFQLAKRGEFPGAMKIGGRWKVSLPKLRRIVHGIDSTVKAES